jgi:hypothetical protein
MRHVVLVWWRHGAIANPEYVYSFEVARHVASYGHRVCDFGACPGVAGV